jgi:hypothetical protein
MLVAFTITACMGAARSFHIRSLAWSTAKLYHARTPSEQRRDFERPRPIYDWLLSIRSRNKTFARLTSTDLWKHIIDVIHSFIRWTTFGT